MPAHRRLLARFLIVLIVLGHGAALYLNAELWPFSPYPMYTNTIRQAYTLEQFDVFGVPAEHAEREIPLWGTRYFQPLDHYRARHALASLHRQPDSEPRMREALADLLQRYERRRVGGHHDGPRLKSLKLYHVTWEVGADKPPTTEPARKQLILEVAGDGASG